MTKKDYEAIARVFSDMRASYFDGSRPHLSESERQCGAYAVKRSAVSMCDVFAADNPRFDRSRFLKACGVEE